MLVMMTGCLPKGDDYLIVPGVRVSNIKADTSEADLVRMFGRQMVIPAEIPMGEGDMEPGTLIFDPDSLSSMGIIWKDKINLKNPREIRWMGTKCKWKTAEGVTLGITLKELETANGKPFKLMGLEWDYAGTFMSSEGGKLAYLDRDRDGSVNAQPGEIIIRMQPATDAEANANVTDYLSVSGDRIVTSDSEVMQKLNPSVYEMIFFFP
jgi:hypothetical protein